MMQLPTIRMSNDQILVPFNPKHVYSIELKPFEVEYVENIPNYYECVIDNAMPGFSWTFICQGRPTAIFGVRPLWSTNFEMWMIPGEGIEKNAIAVLRGARHIIDGIVAEFDVLRLQITVRCENEIAYKFAKRLGFKVESVMRYFGPEGADYYLMTRITE